MAMNYKELREHQGSRGVLTNNHRLDRLLAMMAGWWNGLTYARIGRSYGLSRQRAWAILSRAGCTAALRRRVARLGTPADSPHQAKAELVARARNALLHPKANCLTVRQRAAMAWQAQGCTLAEIAMRMGITPQGVAALVQAGQFRLQRLDWKPQEYVDEPLPFDLGPFEVDDLFGDVDTQEGAG